MPPRRQPPAPPGESKTGLVVALVIFILTTLISGTLAYMFYADNAAMVKGKQDADAAAAAMKEQKNSQELQRIINAIMIGIDTPADREAFNTLKLDGRAYNAALGRVASQVSKVGVVWDPNQEKPNEPLIARAENLATQAKNAQDKLLAAEASFTSTAGNLTKSADEARASTAAALKNQQAAQTNELGAKAAKHKELDDALTTIVGLRTQLEAANKKNENDTVELQKQIKALKESLESKDRRVQRLLAELDTKRDEIFAHDKPKGEVTRVDNRAGIAYVNIGSADFARPQLTFSVLAPNAIGKGAGKRERKGAVEIVKVLGEHLSQARIIDVTNSLQDPLLQGDLLFNPAWDPSQRVHISIAGHIDLNGDGLDDTTELVRNLEKLGVVVDSYLDLRDVTVKGGTMNDATSYLVLGETPQGDETAGAAIGDKDKKKADIRTKIVEMKEQASKLGTTMVKHRDFLNMIGYAIPKNPQRPDFVPSGSVKPAAGAPATAPAPATTPKKDDEGK